MANGHELARQALTTLDFFQAAYAGDSEYQKIHKQVVSYLRNRAETAQTRGEWDAKFLHLFAETLEEAQKGGAYVPRP